MKKLLGIAMIAALLSACVPPHHDRHHGEPVGGGHGHERGQPHGPK